MKLPAIKAKIGKNTYYITTMSFQEVSDNVSKIDDEIYHSQTLKDILQRGLTENYKSIRHYILNQKDRFFNSLVLAVYNDYPDWREIEFRFNEFETYSMGILEFTDKHKIFPIDGQHRVEGIKAALEENPGLGKDRIGAIFVGHIDSEQGKMNTRRLFTTLNRYAKPVKLNDIIILDEDDIVAIVTRNLIEGHKLFTNKRILISEQKAIPKTNKDALTTIITLYQANVELYKYFHFKNSGSHLTGTQLKENLKFRPDEKEIKRFNTFTKDFWDNFVKHFSVIKTYLEKTSNPAEEFRDESNGGNLIFRPAAFIPLILAILKITAYRNCEFKEVMMEYNNKNFNINIAPWVKILWDPTQNHMIMNHGTLVYFILVSLVDKGALSSKEIAKMEQNYSFITGYELNLPTI